MKEAAETIIKSTRHQKIIGDYGEHLVCNWLSRSGFEVARVDHVGIDVVAASPDGSKRRGISVRSRTRTMGKETGKVNLLAGSGKDRQKLLYACTAFNLEPWLAVYVECADSADLFLTSLAHYDEKFRSKKATVNELWKMGVKDVQTYQHDREVEHVHFDFKIGNLVQCGAPQSA